MRVIAGTAGSLPLKTPEGLDTRPTTDRIKETLFNMLQPDIPGAVFVDLFSGSGAIGIEALSRGAERAYFVDNSPKALACIQQNLTFTKTANRAIVLKQDVCSALSGIRERKVDIVFMDPPYDRELEKDVLALLKGMSYVTEDTLIIVEASLETKFLYLAEYGFYMEKDKRYKTNRHVFLRRTAL
ncbi:MAG: 16S rRNA (guanine(966)-N(2))-methyltransferase RsmD [Butyrivibrio sp.]|nr:16S rRNA (guanine(966)-N(2))-methyltransferase RsmD [Acetatifactor muris]MCM1558007.1 16S rRNA (guanine(966)-N(2))-methyltransferase RsmD [Butyrivibrio sp.]